MAMIDLCERGLVPDFLTRLGIRRLCAQRLREEHDGDLDRADALVGDLDDPEHAAAARNALIQLLLDRHGTGRVLFRNTRNTVHGFPSRLLHGRALPPPEHYRTRMESLEARLWPESSSADPEWWRHDPRVHWLLGNIDWSLLGALLLGSLPGIWLGSHFAVKVPERWLRSGLAALLVLIGTKLVF